MKKLKLLSLALIALVPMVLLTAAPVSACSQGHSPGYWKNHTDVWPGGRTTGDLYRVAFNLGAPPYRSGSYLAAYPNLTLGQALELGKSKDFQGGELAFLRQSVATLLNQGADPDEIAFLQRLVKYVYAHNGGGYADPPGPGYWGAVGGSTWTLSDWATWFDSMNSLY